MPPKTRLSQKSPPKSQRIEQSQEVRNDVNLDEQVNDLVRHFVNRAGEHIPFKRADLKKNILPKSGNSFQEIVNRAAKILDEVYGYKLLVIDAAQGVTKSYIVTNALSYVSDPPDEPPENQYPDDVNKVLTMLVLSHVFMSNNSATDSSLHTFLNSLGIDIERRHKILGNVKEFVNVTLKNKKYLALDVNQKTKKITYSWGPRAEKEISKHSILRFVSKMYSTSPSSWQTQYKAAMEQQKANKKPEIEEATQNTQQ